MALINCPECNKEISDKAGACPSCGHPMEKPIVVTPIVAPPNHDPNIKLCPSCKSENTQTIKMMCLNGTTSGTSTAIGVSSSLDVGVAAVGSRSQTNLAAQYNPGIKPDASGCGCLFIGVAAFFALIGFIALSENNSGGWMAIVFAIGFGAFGKFFPFNKTVAEKLKTWESKNRLFETGWICHKCGHTWNP